MKIVRRPLLYGVADWFGASFVLARPEEAVPSILVGFGALVIAATSAGLAGRAYERIGKLQARAQAERSYETFIDNAIEGFFRTTYDGRYLKVNPTLARIYGYETPEQLMAEITDIGN